MGRRVDKRSSLRICIPAHHSSTCPSAPYLLPLPSTPTPQRDTRYSKQLLSTHDKNGCHAFSACNLGEVASEVADADIIGVDEGSFFPDLVERCEAWANSGKTVIIAALDGTFQREVCEQ